MSARQVKILGTGIHLPENTVSGAELDRRLGLDEGTTTRISGVELRSYAKNETSSQMGAWAAMAALENANLRYEDIDLIVCASGTMQQPIPCNAALTQSALGKGNSGTPCFDINSTCLSFVTALDTLSYAIDAGRYQRILLISSDITSVALNYDHLESCSLFGDGAAAVVLGRTPDGESSRILTSHMETYSDGIEHCQVRGGGTALHSRQHDKSNEKDFLFFMNGRKVFRLASEIAPPFLEKLMGFAQLTMEDIKIVIPHQASMTGMMLMRERLGIPEHKWMTILPNFGNVVAASIPMALHEAIRNKKIQRGDRALLLGTSAGLSIGGLVLEY